MALARGIGVEPKVSALSGDVHFPASIAHREFLGASLRYGLTLVDQEVMIDVPFRSVDVLHETGAEVSAMMPELALPWLQRCTLMAGERTLRVTRPWHLAWRVARCEGRR